MEIEIETGSDGQHRLIHLHRLIHPTSSYSSERNVQHHHSAFQFTFEAWTLTGIRVSPYPECCEQAWNLYYGEVLFLAPIHFILKVLFHWKPQNFFPSNLLFSLALLGRLLDGFDWNHVNCLGASPLGLSKVSFDFEDLWQDCCYFIWFLGEMRFLNHYSD